VPEPLYSSSKIQAALLLEISGEERRDRAGEEGG